jgi:hypothetical protein
MHETWGTERETSRSQSVIRQIMIRNRSKKIGVIV